MNASEDEIGEKILTLKTLASKRIDEILKARDDKKNGDGISFINSIFSWFKK